MPILGIEQPNIIEIDNYLRLRRYHKENDFALRWYQDEETLLLVDGKYEPYDIDRLNKMYAYLNAKGELYFIEIKKDNCYIPIGDVTFWQEDIPIVIGDKEYRGKGIGKKVIVALVQRAKQLGYALIYVNEIYKYNVSSQKLFENVGFERYEETEKGYSYRFYCIKLP